MFQNVCRAFFSFENKALSAITEVYWILPMQDESKYVSSVNVSPKANTGQNQISFFSP